MRPLWIGLLIAASAALTIPSSARSTRKPESSMIPDYFSPTR